jgi:16S rRNA (adenine1518-N6/adenine1519-N6)-dimethyltransferase
VSLGQNFLADPNLLEAIVREADLSADDVVLEVGGGHGVLTERLAAAASVVHVIEIDERLRAGLEEIAARREGVGLVMGDAMKVDFRELEPPPSAIVANLPYSVATPVIMRSIEELGSVQRWTVMVQREIADRLRAVPRTKPYGAPSVLAQLACRVEMLRAVDRRVFKPPPRVDSALLRLERVAEWPGDDVARLVRAAFAHRRKALARSVATAGVESRQRVLEALSTMGKDPMARAEELEPREFVALAKELES